MTAPQHRRHCACRGATPDIQQICIAHGTAVRRARDLVATTYPGSWFIGDGDLTTSPDGLRMEMDLSDVEWTTVHQMRRRVHRLGRATAHLDLYLAVVAELLPARQRRALQRRRVLRADTEATA